MILLIIYILGIFVGNLLIILNWFSLGNDTGYLTGIGWVILLVSIVSFSTRIAGLITKYKFSYSDILFSSILSNGKLVRPTKIMFLILTIMTSLHIVFYFQFVKYQDKLLNDKGILITTIINKKTWHKNSSYAHYTINYNKKTYNISKHLDSFNVGDSITIKFLANNPYNCKIYKLKK